MVKSLGAIHNNSLYYEHDLVVPMSSNFSAAHGLLELLFLARDKPPYT